MSDQRERLSSAIKAYHDYLYRRGRVSELELNKLMLAAESVVPNAMLTDIISFGERERTTEEVIDEALDREAIWQRSGTRGVLQHIIQAYSRALENFNLHPAVRERHEMVLNYAVDQMENCD